jgi:hypothetical protein
VTGAGPWAVLKASVRILAFTLSEVGAMGGLRAGEGCDMTVQVPVNQPSPLPRPDPSARPAHPLCVLAPVVTEKS